MEPQPQPTLRTLTFPIPLARGDAKQLAQTCPIISSLDHCSGVGSIILVGGHQFVGHNNYIYIYYYIYIYIILYIYIYIYIYYI